MRLAMPPLLAARRASQAHARRRRRARIPTLRLIRDEHSNFGRRARRPPPHSPDPIPFRAAARLESSLTILAAV